MNFIFTNTIKISFILLSLVICFPLGAAEKYAGEFLTLGAGARPLGMGGSFAAVADDATAAYWNPAGLGGLNRSEITLMHASVFGMDKYNFINYVQPVGSGALGISWIRLGIDDIPFTALHYSENMSASNRPYVSRYIQDNENAFLLSYGKKLKAGFPGIKLQQGTDFQVGGNFKFIYHSASGVNRNAIGFGGDIGIIWRTSFISRKDDANASDTKSGWLSLGVSAQDFFKTRLVWNTTSSPSHTDVIQPNVKIGVAYSRKVPGLGGEFLLAVDADTRYGLEMHYGTEYVLGNILALRAGIQEKNFTAGTGLNIELSSLSFLVDYAFLGHEIGNTHRISVTTKF